MDYYNKNINIIKSSSEYLYNDIISFQDNAKYRSTEIIINSIPSRDQNLVLTIQKNDNYYRMNSIYRPIEEARKWVEQYNLSKLMITISMYGFGNGYFVREFAMQLKKNDIFLIYEPSMEVFIHAISNYDLKDILEDRRIIIFSGENGKKQFNGTYGSRIHWSNINSVINCKHPRYEDVFPDSLKYFENAIIENIERILANHKFENEFNRETVKNLLGSIKCMANTNCLDDLKGVWDNEIPVIIVAAGPSLDINIGELKNAKNKSIIIATDTALQILRNHDIEPDVLITVDPKKELELFKNVGYEKLPMICTTYSTYQVIYNHIGKKIWFAIHPYMLKLYNDIGMNRKTYNTGASVATAAFSVARTLGTKKIILIGQDLAYKGEYTHAGKKISSNDQRMGICYIEGVDGMLVRSRADWRYFLTWFERMILEDTDGSNIVIDATEGGARIKGTKIMTLKNAIDTYCIKSVDVNEIFKNLEPTINKEELLKITEYIEKDLYELEEIIKLSIESGDLCNEVIYEYKIKKIVTPLITKKYKRISRINEIITHKEIYMLAEELMKGKNISVLQEVNNLSDDAYNNLLNTYTIQRQIMNDLKESAQELIPLIIDCINCIRNNS